MQDFHFLDQAVAVKELLKAAVAAFPFLSLNERADLEAACRRFESCAAITTLSVNDVNVDEHELSEDEKKEVINRFRAQYSVPETDLVKLDALVGKVVEERSPAPRM